MAINKLTLIVLIIFGFITLIELLYYYVIFARFAFQKKRKVTSAEQVPVSIILVVKDAASTLLKTLPRLLNQHYGQFEIVVVNDNSRDETEMLVVEYKNQYPNIKLVNLDSAVTTIRGRKFAISMGIRCASYEHLLFIDAECVPTSSHWLEKMASHFADRKSIVIGYSTYEKRNSFFNRMLHFDTLFNAVQYFSHAIIGSTYRADGKNMAFNKVLFTKQRGFAAHNHISCGEEDIFISKAATKKNTAIEYDPEAFTVLQRKSKHTYWLSHKEGLYYTRKFNTLKNRILLASYDLINLLFYVALVVAILLTKADIMLLSIVLGIIFVRIVSQYLVFGFSAKKLNEKQVIPCLLIYDLLFAILNPLYYLLSKINHKKFL